MARSVQEPTSPPRSHGVEMTLGTQVGSLGSPSKPGAAP